MECSTWLFALSHTPKMQQPVCKNAGAVRVAPRGLQHHTGPPGWPSIKAARQKGRWHSLSLLQRAVKIATGWLQLRPLFSQRTGPSLSNCPCCDEVSRSFAASLRRILWLAHCGLNKLSLSKCAPRTHQGERDGFFLPIYTHAISHFLLRSQPINHFLSQKKLPSARHCFCNANWEFGWMTAVKRCAVDCLLKLHSRGILFFIPKIQNLRILLFLRAPSIFTTKGFFY